MAKLLRSPSLAAAIKATARRYWKEDEDDKEKRPFRVIGIDPGRTTGWAVYDSEAGGFVTSGCLFTPHDNPWAVHQAVSFFSDCVLRDRWNENSHRLLAVVFEESNLTGQRALPGKHDQIAAHAVLQQAILDFAGQEYELDIATVKPEIRKVALGKLEKFAGAPESGHARDAAALVVAFLQDDGSATTEV